MRFLSTLLGLLCLSAFARAQTPVIVVQPQSQSVVAGGTVVFSVSATGASTYQWEFNGVGITGATSATLTLTDVTTAQAGAYSVYVFNGANAIGSAGATLTVLLTPAITSPMTATAYVGGNFTYAITASNSPTSFGVEGNLPPGCTFNPATGVISGSPSSAGSYAIAITASNQNGVSAETLTVTVSSSPPTTWSVSTLAGNPTGSSGSADGIGVHAQFGNSQGLAVDQTGVVYVADTGNNIIRKVAPDGTVTTVAGTAGVTGALDGTGPAAQFNAPSAIVADPAGNLFVADSNNCTIRKITPTGVVTTIAGFPGIAGNSNGTGLTARFHNPEGLAIDASENLYVADTANGLVRKITPGGVVTTVATSGGPEPINPYGIAINGSGIIFVWDIGLNAILTIAPSGTATLFANTPSGPDGSAKGGIALDAAGNAYIVYDKLNAFGESGGAQLWQISPTGVLKVLVSDFLDYPIPFSLSPAIAVDGAGRIYLSAYNSIVVAAPMAAPAITVQPQSQSIATGGTVVLSVTTNGTPAPTYQWQVDGANIVGATSANYAASQPGVYTVVVTNTTGSVTSAAAVISAATRLVNVSTRAQVGTGANVEIAGFIVSGPPSDTETVLLRGVGPTLAQYGVSGVLARPVLTVYDSTGKAIANNVGWGTNANAAQIASAEAATGAFVLPSGSADSALLLNLSPGAYTAEVSGLNGTTGVALVEVYEVSAGSPEIINLSTRALVGVGSSVQIAGLVVTGSGPEKVLVRAVGPALAQFGVSGILAQPSLAVLNSAGAIIASNTGWSTSDVAAAITAEAQAVGAFPLSPGSADCAVLLTLSPGIYTAVVSGVSDSSGVALVEIYQAP